MVHTSGPVIVTSSIFPVEKSVAYSVGQPADPVGSHDEAGVAHAQRFEEAVLEKDAQWLACRARDQNAEHERGRVVLPPLARLVHQGQRCEVSDPVVGVVRRARVRLRHGELKFLRTLDDRIRRIKPRGLDDDEAIARPKRQQILARDRAVGGNGLVDRAVHALQHAAGGQLGEQPGDRLVQRQPAVIDQEHRRGSKDGLGHRRDAKDRVPPHRPVAAERHGADHVDVDIVALGNQCHDARQAAILDPGRHRLVEPVKAGLGQRRGLHTFGSAVALAYSGRPAVRYVWMVMPREVVRELTSSSAMSGPESENSRVPWPMMTG